MKLDYEKYGLDEKVMDKFGLGVAGKLSAYFNAAYEDKIGALIKYPNGGFGVDVDVVNKHNRKIGIGFVAVTLIGSIIAKKLAEK